MTFSIVMRRLNEINTDPQRRCYNGCHAKSEMVWSDWEVLESGISKEKANDRLRFWRELNGYAVSQRGEANTLCEFLAEEE